MDGLDALNIAESKKTYIVDLLNPVLEEMVAECIHRMPEDPTPFMLEWLEQKSITEEEKLLSPERKEELHNENKKLEEQIKKVKNQMQEAAKMAVTDDNQKDEEEEEEEDDFDEPPPDFFKDQSGKARQSVSAEAYGQWNTKKAFVAPVITKTDEQKDRLKSVLLENFMFKALDETDLGIIIGAMKETALEPNQRVIQQGDQGDFLFVIESGTFDCLIKQEGAEEVVVKTCVPGDAFGELALLYNAPRKASVQSKEHAVVWQLDRDTFNHIVSEAAQKKRNRYDAFLAKVPLLQSMNAYERSQLADALHQEVFSDGQIVMSQGEVGHKFYIIEEGQVVATKGGVEVMNYGPGDYFGELALIRDQPRAATCACKGPCRLLSLDNGSFKRLLNVSDLLDRSHQRYTM